MSKLTPTFNSFEDKLRRAAQMPGPSAGFQASLRERLTKSSARVNQYPVRRPILIQRPLGAALILLLLAALLTFAFVGPQRVLAAVRQLLGYVPGIGYVQDVDAIRVLSEPVQLEREGITLEVQQGAVDAERTVLIYQTQGLSIAAANSQSEDVSTGSLALLVLPDGTFLRQNGGDGTGWGTGYQTRLIFPALPMGIDEAVLFIPRLQDMPTGAAPEDWQLRLHFKHDPDGLNVMPVYEITSQAASLPLAASSTPVLSASSSLQTPQHGIQIQLDRVADLSDGYLLQGSTLWEGQDQFNSVGFDIYSVLTDASGQTIPVQREPPDASAEDLSSDQRALWALKVQGKGYPGPWMLSIPQVEVEQRVDLAFQFDPGPNPQPGQEWVLNQELEAAGLTLRVVSAKLGQKADGSLWLNFGFAADPALLAVNVSPADINARGFSSFSGPGAEPGSLVSGISLEGLPAVPVRIEINSIVFNLAGSWQMSWNPPASDPSLLVPTVSPLACLTQNVWEQLKSQPVSDPGLTGRLLLEENTGQLMPLISLINPDGSQKQNIDIGGWSSLSPDGSTVAYVRSNGPNIFLADTRSGEIRALQGSVPEDYHPVWSLDGQRLAFVRGTSGIYVLALDGSGVQQVTNSSTFSSVVGWLPDNQNLVISTLTADGSLLQAVNMDSGVVQDAFVIENMKGGFVQLSPDGKRVAFSETSKTSSSYAIWVANLDGSSRRLVVDLDGVGSTATAWSPDSRWLVVTLSEWNAVKEIEMPWLVQPDSCQVMRFASPDGNIRSWVQLSTGGE